LNLQTRLSGSAWLPTGVLLAVLCARWVLVVGYGDFGGDYDIVSRLAQGQWQGRDFYAVLSFGSSYSALLFEKLFGDRLLAVSIHVWFWWLFNAISAGGVAAAAGASKRVSAFTVCAVALLAVPPNSHSSAFGFMASALSGFATILLIRQFTQATRLWALAAGLLGGAAMFTKPNEGVALVTGQIAVCLGIAWFQPTARRKALSASFALSAGIVLGLAAVLAVPGYVGGYRELVGEIFLGGVSIKGGIETVLLRTVPRISTSIDSPHRFVIELALTTPIFVGSLLLFARLFRGKIGAGEDSKQPEQVLLWLVLGSVLALSIWSLFPWQEPERLTALFYRIGIVSLPFFLCQILYLIELAALLASVFAGWKEREFMHSGTAASWLAVLALIWTCGVAASGRYNSVFATTLLIPAVALRMKDRLSEPKYYRYLSVFLVAWTIAWHIAPNWRSTFAHLTRLPEGSKFAGLYWPDGGASTPGSYPLWSSSSMIEQCQKNIAPRVAGHSVLWLAPSAGAAFGGKIYRYGVNGLASNYITPTAEARLAESVKSAPPDYIVSSDLEDWKSGEWKFLKPSVAEPWLEANYSRVWSLADSPVPLFLWQRKG